MECPICGGETKVIDSRPFYGAIKRRRECLCCSHRFTTEELGKEDIVRLLSILNNNEFNGALGDLERAESLYDLEHARIRLLDVCYRYTKAKEA